MQQICRKRSQKNKPTNHNKPQMAVYLRFSVLRNQHDYRIKQRYPQQDMCDRVHLPEASNPGKLQYKLYRQIQICQRADNI